MRTEKNSRELLAVLSHELRTPVTVIRSTLEALQGEVPDRLRKRFLERAVTESERLVRLLEDLTIDVKPPQYRRIEVKEVADRAVALLHVVFAKHHVHLESSIDDLTVWADADKLLQIFINLLENAAIHGPDEAIIKLFICRDQSNAAFASIAVQDQGTPLHAETIEQLFEPHSRGSGVKIKGTGLGLYIVRNIAKALGGSAWGKPLPEGNEFGVLIPLNR
jgi:signal transduction histidine kinase